MLWQFARFSLVGASSSLVNFAAYNLIRLTFRHFELFGEHGYLPALFAGFVLSVLWAYLLSRRFVFSSEEEKQVPWTQALPRMYLAYGFTGLVLNSLLSLLWVDVLGIPEAIISVINDTIAAPVNFLLIKYWSFGKGK